jgi:hypothetical protein
MLRVELLDHDLLTFEFDVVIDNSLSATFESRPFCDFVNAIAHFVQVYVHLGKDVIVSANFHSQGCAHGLDGESSLMIMISIGSSILWFVQTDVEPWRIRRFHLRQHSVAPFWSAIGLKRLDEVL